jgi:hypothetical protein
MFAAVAALMDLRVAGRAEWAGPAALQGLSGQEILQMRRVCQTYIMMYNIKYINKSQRHFALPYI